MSDEADRVAMERQRAREWRATQSEVTSNGGLKGRGFEDIVAEKR